MVFLKKYEVVAAMLVHQDKVLLARRHPDGSQGGLWEFPGGKIEAGETPNQALEREIREELGITITAGDCLATSEHHYGDKIVRLHGHLCHWHPQDIQLTGSHDRWCWHGADDTLPGPLAPADEPLIAALWQHLGNKDTMQPTKTPDL